MNPENVNPEADAESMEALDQPEMDGDATSSELVADLEALAKADTGGTPPDDIEAAMRAVSDSEKSTNDLAEVIGQIDEAEVAAKLKAAAEAPLDDESVTLTNEERAKLELASEEGPDDLANAKAQLDDDAAALVDIVTSAMEGPEETSDARAAAVTAAEAKVNAAMDAGEPVSFEKIGSELRKDLQEIAAKQEAENHDADKEAAPARRFDRDIVPAGYERDRRASLLERFSYKVESATHAISVMRVMYYGFARSIFIELPDGPESFRALEMLYNSRTRALAALTVNTEEPG